MSCFPSVSVQLHSHFRSFVHFSKSPKTALKKYIPQVGVEPGSRGSKGRVLTIKTMMVLQTWVLTRFMVNTAVYHYTYKKEARAGS